MIDERRKKALYDVCDNFVWSNFHVLIYLNIEKLYNSHCISESLTITV